MPKPTNCTLRRRLSRLSVVAFSVSIGLAAGAANAPLADASCSYPGQLLSLSGWKLQLPTGLSGVVTEVTAPTLIEYSAPPYFTVASSCQGVAFRAPTNGVTTSGSSYPRSELRQLIPGGTVAASWSSKEGTHTMQVEEAISEVPKGKRQIIAGQIHDTLSDAVSVRLNYPKLFISHNGATGAMLSTRYVLGTRFAIKWEVKRGVVLTYFNGALAESYPLAEEGLYFKAGDYTLSNCATEAERGYTCGPGDYGEVILYSLEVATQ
jgi:hypothetical protein